MLLTIVGTYRGLLDEIVTRNYNVLDGRVSVAQSGEKRLSCCERWQVRFTSADAGRKLESGTSKIQRVGHTTEMTMIPAHLRMSSSWAAGSPGWRSHRVS